MYTVTIKKHCKSKHCYTVIGRLTDDREFTKSDIEKRAAVWTHAVC